MVKVLAAHQPMLSVPRGAIHLRLQPLRSVKNLLHQKSLFVKMCGEELRKIDSLLSNGSEIGRLGRS